MKIKSIIFFLSCFILTTNSCLYALTPEVTPAPRPPAANNSAKAPTPNLDFSEEDMKMFSEFIESLDQETIDALTAIGEEIIKEADELGIDPFDYIEMQAQVQEEFEKPTVPTPAQPGKVVEPERKAPVLIDVNTIDMLKNLVHLIGNIRQKAQDNKDFSNQLIPFKYRLDDLVSYLNLLTHEKLSKYLTKRI